MSLEPGRRSHAPACAAAVVVALNAEELDWRGETALCALALDAVRALQAEHVWICGWSQLRERAWRRLCDEAAKSGRYPSAVVHRLLNTVCRRAWRMSKHSIRELQEGRSRRRTAAEESSWPARLGIATPSTGGLLS